MKQRKIIPVMLTVSILLISVFSANAAFAAGAGWRTNSEGRYYYLLEDGSCARGWTTIDGYLYCFSSIGFLKTGWVALDGKNYYMDPATFKWASGWQKIGSSWYYFNPSTKTPVAGWIKLNDAWYYMDPSSLVAATGWKKINGTWYYFNQNCSMATGWVKDNGKWYYMDPNGSLAIGWRTIKSKTYYFNENGTMATGTVSIDGYTYRFADDGHLYVYDESYVSAVLNAINRTPATPSGYCAMWVSNVFKNAGVLNYQLESLRPTYYSYATTSGLADAYYTGDFGFNANDYWAYVCYSSDTNDLKPGMIVATRSAHSYLGEQFGHVGIYIGNGKVVSCIGYLETLTLSEWAQKYNNTEKGSTIAWGYLPY